MDRGRHENVYNLGILWQSSGATLTLTRAWVQSLVGEVRSCKPQSIAKTTLSIMPSNILRPTNTGSE